MQNFSLNYAFDSNFPTPISALVLDVVILISPLAHEPFKYWSTAHVLSVGPEDILGRHLKGK